MSLLAWVLLSGCQARLDVAIEAKGNGAGTVHVRLGLDAAALRAAGGMDGLRGQLRVEDLAPAAWVVTGPEPAARGGVVVMARKRFSSPSELTSVMEEISGAGGPFREFRLEQDRGLITTRTRLRGVVDLRSGLGAFGDERLMQLTGSRFGVDAAALQRRLGRDLAEVFVISVRARLPGEEHGSGAGGLAVWQPRLGERTAVEAEASSTNWFQTGALGATVVAAVGLIGLLLLRGRRDHL